MNTKLSSYVLVVVVILTLVNLYVNFRINGRLSELSGPADRPSGITGAVAADEPVKDVQRVEVGVDGEPSIGSSDAPVEVVVFSDFECPFCARFAQQTLAGLKDFVDAGRLRLVFRNFPLPFHSDAQKAAEAAECASEQGKFWEFHDRLFASQNDLAVASLKNYAKEMGLDSAGFDECLDSGRMAAEVQSDLADGEKAGVSGTPTSFVNGIIVVGAQPPEAFRKVIEQELA
jgi:protein-disulfide isomerase